MFPITFEDVTCHYAGAPEPAVSGLDLQVVGGELLALCGDPGSGKSTVLRMLAGLVPVTDGRILVDGRELTDPELPPVVLVFQNYALQPHLTVLQNIGLPLSLLRLDKRAVAQRSAEAAEHVGLADVLKRRGSDLTAGQRVRVALARALVRDPAALLLDEPMAHLHPGLRAEVTELVVAAQRARGITTIYATNDPEEALAIGDRVALLDAGRLREAVVPADVRSGPTGQRVERSGQDMVPAPRAPSSSVRDRQS